MVRPSVDDYTDRCSTSLILANLYNVANSDLTFPVSPVSVEDRVSHLVPPVDVYNVTGLVVVVKKKDLFFVKCELVKRFPPDDVPHLIASCWL